MRRVCELWRIYFFPRVSVIREAELVVEDHAWRCRHQTFVEFIDELTLISVKLNFISRLILRDPLYLSQYAVVSPSEDLYFEMDPRSSETMSGTNNVHSFLLLGIITNRSTNPVTSATSSYSQRLL